MQKINHIPTADEAYNKYSALCARQECCRHDLAEKMVRKGMSEQAIATVLEQLTSEGFIDEERFCRAFIHDKLHFSKWGKIRLRTELRMRRIAHETIEQCLREIDDEDYLDILKELLQAYTPTVTAKSSYEMQCKIVRFAYQHGFEQALSLPLAESLAGQL